MLTLCILMSFTKHVVTISMGLPIVYFEGYNLLNYSIFLPLKIVLILANSADPDEKQHSAAFQMCLNCLPK